MAKRSAGLLVWRRTATGVEVLLGHPGGPQYARRDVWTMPKGEYDGEEPLAAARREFAEETGLEPPAGEAAPLGEVRQKGGKVVCAWAIEGDVDLGAFSPGTFAMVWPPRSGRVQDFPELDRLAWVPLEQARSTVYEAQVLFLDRLVEVSGR